jgi:amidase
VGAALADTEALCRRLGHRVEQTAPPPIDGARLGAAFFTLAGQAMAGLSEMMAPLLGRAVDDRDLEPFTLQLVEWFRTLPPGAVAEARGSIEELGAAMRRYLEGFDVLLCPTIAVEPWEIGTVAPTLDRETILERAGVLAGYTAIHNFAGTPAMSVPLGVSGEGLPIGSHFAAGPGGEATLLSLAYELEEAAPWRGRLPPPALAAQ